MAFSNIVSIIHPSFLLLLSYCPLPSSPTEAHPLFLFLPSYHQYPVISFPRTLFSLLHCPVLLFFPHCGNSRLYTYIWKFGAWNYKWNKTLFIYFFGQGDYREAIWGLFFMGSHPLGWSVDIPFLKATTEQVPKYACLPSLCLCHVCYYPIDENKSHDQHQPYSQGSRDTRDGEVVLLVNWLPC